jgi:hypothetical protein
LDNRNDRQDRWKPSIHLDEEPAVVVGRLSSTPLPAPQDDQLMSEHHILRSRNFDLNGEARTARAKQSTPIIPPA